MHLVDFDPSFVRQRDEEFGSETAGHRLEEWLRANRERLSERGNVGGACSSALALLSRGLKQVGLLANSRAGRGGARGDE
jgi:hypothetical protein